MRRDSGSEGSTDSPRNAWPSVLRLPPLNRWRAAAFVILLAGTIFAALTKFGSAADGVYLNAKDHPIPPAYFGLHIHDAQLSAWPAIPFGAWRLWDAQGSVWPDLEPQKGQWNFERLDKYVESAHGRSVEILLPLAHSPAWASARPDEPSAYGPGWAAEPRDIADWRNYVRRVGQRYKGVVRYYEVWNEPNVKRFYSGSVEQLVALTRAAREELKAIDPTVVVVSPSYVDPTGLKQLDEFLARGGGKYVDVIGFHFYATSERPEDMLSMIQRVRRVMEKRGVGGKPLWNTEVGWIIATSRGPIDPVKVGFPRETPVLNAEEASAYVARSLILSWAAGVNRLYWYAWDNKAMGLSEDDGKILKPAAHAYSQTYRWLRNGTLDFCRSSSRGVWACQLTGHGGERAWLVWSTGGVARWMPPTDWRPEEREELDGRLTRIIGAEKGVAIGTSPVLIRSATLRQVSLP